MTFGRTTRRTHISSLMLPLALIVCLHLVPASWGQDTQSLAEGKDQASIQIVRDDAFRTYRLTTNVRLRDNKRPDKQITFSEIPEHASIRTGNPLFDGLYAMAISEALANSVSQISDRNFGKGAPVQIDAFQTGEAWPYVWTRDVSYSIHLGLAGFDPPRAENSLLFKSSVLKPSVVGGVPNQIIQDTGSGGSYPVSTDRAVWALGANETLKYLAGTERESFLEKVYPILCDTIEQDRRLIFDAETGLYRGEHSFLDWREQTYPGWTKANVLAIAMSEALSVNALDYFLLRTAADYSRLLKRPDQQSRYSKWADDLKDSINHQLFDEKAGLYSTYLLCDGNQGIKVARYDLLGESLAILLGVADRERAQAIIRNYPVGPYGPPVVWPQERTVPIYHNQAMWPFVTAYWIKAAKSAEIPAAVDAGVQSLEQLAALNLSNMENADFVTGRSRVKDGPRKGPVVDSSRQLWSVAGYLSMVQDVVFGLESSWEGIRFRPFLTAKMRNETFGSTDAIELRGLAFQGTRSRVRVHLPPVNSFSQGVCVVDRVELNGKPIGPEFVKTDSLQHENLWEIFLKTPAQTTGDAPLRVVDVSNERAICGPLQPRWRDDPQGGIALKDGHIVLSYQDDDGANVTFNIYRDGQLCAQGIVQTTWTDPGSDDHRATVHSYAVEAVDARTGNASHLTPSRSYRDQDQQQVIPAKAMENIGGDLAEDHHFENWGKSKDELQTRAFTVNLRGRYQVRVEFSNGAGPVNTGITCAVKRLEVRKAGSADAIASGYLVMPQSGDWKRWDLSSPVIADLHPEEQYTIRISEDQYSRNMSYLRNNERYTGFGGAGGGAQASNYVNIAAVHLLYVAKGNP